MHTSSKSIIIASLVLPLLLVACNRADQSPATGSNASQEKMAKNPSDQMTEKSQPSPADASKNPAAPSSSAPSAAPGAAPADQKTEQK